MKRLRDQRGMSLTESLVATTVAVIVLAATLVVFDAFASNWGVTTRQSESQQRSRLATQTLSKQLRNLASPDNFLPRAINKADQYDLVFQTVNRGSASAGNLRNIKRVRYCLTSAVNSKSRLMRQEQTWTSGAPAVPSTASCPDAAWPTIAGTTSNSALVASDIVNRSVKSPTRVFTYDSSVIDDITAVDTELLVDVNPGKRPVEASLRSGVFLRNQNRRPKASFTVTNSGNHRVLLNASASQDPEGAPPRTFVWYANGNTSTPIANGIIAYWQPPGNTWPQTHSFTLRVCDPAFASTTHSNGLQVCNTSGLSADTSITGWVIP